jgi:hypothetical protein
VVCVDRLEVWGAAVVVLCVDLLGVWGAAVVVLRVGVLRVVVWFCCVVPWASSRPQTAGLVVLGKAGRNGGKGQSGGSCQKGQVTHGFILYCLIGILVP